VVAVAGAAVGGISGQQIGGGSGRDVATVPGVIGGGLAGDAARNRHADRQPGQQIDVRLDDVVEVTITQRADSALRVGDRVYTKGCGSEGRVAEARGRPRCAGQLLALSTARVGAAAPARCAPRRRRVRQARPATLGMRTPPPCQL
jgi:uncharacterized protein YcfJ